MRRKAFENSARELSLDPKHWDKAYKAIRTKDELTRLIWEVDAQNKPSLIAVCRIFGSAGQGQVLVKHKTVRVRIPLSWRNMKDPYGGRNFSKGRKCANCGLPIENNRTDTVCHVCRSMHTFMGTPINE